MVPQCPGLGSQVRPVRRAADSPLPSPALRESDEEEPSATSSVYGLLGILPGLKLGDCVSFRLLLLGARKRTAPQGCPWRTSARALRKVLVSHGPASIRARGLRAASQHR
jgi:hypothetical protein